MVWLQNKVEDCTMTGAVGLGALDSDLEVLSPLAKRLKKGPRKVAQRVVTQESCYCQYL